MELHRTGGIALPAGFGNALQTDNTGELEAAETTKKITGTSATPWLGAAGPPPLKVWQKLAILAGFLLIVFLAAGFLDK
jgi:hypothetical protein